MKTTYLDTSAAMKLLVQEEESDALVAELLNQDPRQLVASWLLHTELHCAAGRNPTLIQPEHVQAVLDSVTLIDVTRGDLLAAGTHVPLRSADAIHLVTALRVGADQMATYDLELGAAARRSGLEVLAPS